jgi:hypothetical protein
MLILSKKDQKNAKGILEEYMIGHNAAHLKQRC